MTYRAYLGDLSKYSYLKCIQDGLDDIQFGKIVYQDARLFIKPNLTFPSTNLA